MSPKCDVPLLNLNFVRRCVAGTKGRSDKELEVGKGEATSEEADWAEKRCLASSAFRRDRIEDATLAKCSAIRGDSSCRVFCIVQSLANESSLLMARNSGVC